MTRRRLIVVLAAAVALVAGPAGAASASPAAAEAAGRATVTHYTWQGDCGCFGHIVENGVHVTNTRFPGADDGNGVATGGRDNFSGTVSLPPAQELVFSGPGDGEWCSDYDGQCTEQWTWTIEPDGTMSGWAIYPAG